MDFNKILSVIIVITVASTGILALLLVIVIDRLREVIDVLRGFRQDFTSIRRDVKYIERKV